MAQTINLNTQCTLQLRQKKLPEGNFEAFIIDAVDEILSSFGHSCKQSIYFQLESIYKIKKQEIPLRIEDFANAIEHIFGIGAKFIELKIIEMLHEKTKDFLYFPQEEDLVFTEYVTNLRLFFGDRKLNSTVPRFTKKTTFIQTLTK